MIFVIKYSKIQKRGIKKWTGQKKKYFTNANRTG